MSRIKNIKTNLSKHKSAYSKLLNAEKPDLSKISKAIEKQFKLLKEFADEIEKMPIGDERKKAVKQLKANKVKFFREDREGASRVGASVDEYAKEVEDRRKQELKKAPSMIIDSTGMTVTFDEPEERTEPKKKREIIEEGKKRREEATVAKRKEKKAEKMTERRKKKQLAIKDKKMDVEEDDEDVEMTEQKPLAIEDKRPRRGVPKPRPTPRQKPRAQPLPTPRRRPRAQQIRKQIANLKQQLLLEEDAANEEKQGEKVAIVPVSATSQAGDAMPGPRAEEESKSADLGRMKMLKDGGEIIHVDEDLVMDDEAKVEPMDVDKQPEEMEQRQRMQAPVQQQAQMQRQKETKEDIEVQEESKDDVAAGDQPQAGPAQPRHMGRPTMEAPPAQEQAERQRVGQAYEEKMDVQDDERKVDERPQEQPKPPGMPAGPPEEFVQEKFAYPDAPPHHLGIKAVPPSMDLDMEKRQRMSKSIDVLKMEIKCFRELYKGKIRTKKFMELAKINMTQKSLDEVRKIHKRYSDCIRDYYTHSRGLRVGVIVDPAVLGLNVSALQGLLAPRVPSYAPVVNAAREGDKLYPKGQMDKQQSAIRIAETHYQQGGMRHATGDYDRDVESINRSIDKEEIRKEKNRSTTRLPGKLPVFKNYMYRARPTQIASGIKINT